MTDFKNKMKNKKISAALVLSGGGGLGVAHVGALKILEKKYEFEYYAGVSAGAIISAAHAVEYTADEISELIHSQNFFKLAFDFSSSNFGILRGEKVKKLLDEIFQKKNITTFEELEKIGKKLVIFATDFANGERVEISSGNIADAVMASLSVPIVFEPFKKDEKWLVDGGLSGNFPMQEVMNFYSGKKIVGIDVATSLDETKDFSEKKFFGKASGIQNTLERTFRIFFKTQQTFDRSDPRLEIHTPDLTKFKTIDITKLREIEAAGEECIRNFL